MIKATETIEIEDEAIETRAIYASGPGGRHINKNRTAIQVRFDITQACTLSSEVQQRLIENVDASEWLPKWVPSSKTPRVCE